MPPSPRGHRSSTRRAYFYCSKVRSGIQNLVEAAGVEPVCTLLDATARRSLVFAGAVYYRRGGNELTHLPNMTLYVIPLPGRL